MRRSHGEETSQKDITEVMRGSGERLFLSSNDRLNIKECVTKARIKESRFDPDIITISFGSCW